MREELEFYDLKNKRRFKSAEWRIEAKQGKGKLRYFAVAKIPGAAHEAWRILQQDFATAAILDAPKINPFKPTSPVQPGMFVGRLDEVIRLERALLQTRSANPSNFMIVGERGIGKSSLLFYTKAIAEGEIPLRGEGLKFLVIDTDIDQTTSQLGLVKKVEMGLKHALADSEKARSLFASLWGFMQRVEAAGISIRPEIQDQADEGSVEEFAYSLASTVNRLCSEEDSVEMFTTKYDGVLLLIDEADNAPPSLHLGSFLKLLLERLQRRGCQRLMLGLAGLPDLRTVLTSSHPSSLRLFEELELQRLSPEEVRAVIHRGIDTANKATSTSVAITSDAEDFLVSISEGFPHFIQQFCFSAFDTDSDHIIDEKDVMDGAFRRHGAMELIGNRYYRGDFYERIKQESYRQVLRIMADHLDEWVTKRQIRTKFKGKDSTLTNAIQALRDRHIIVSKEGERGVYRLQNKGFAFWIKLYTTSPEDFASHSA